MTTSKSISTGNSYLQQAFTLGTEIVKESARQAVYMAPWVITTVVAPGSELFGRAHTASMVVFTALQAGHLLNEISKGSPIYKKEVACLAVKTTTVVMTASQMYKDSIYKALILIILSTLITIYHHVQNLNAVRQKSFTDIALIKDPKQTAKCIATLIMMVFSLQIAGSNIYTNLSYKNFLETDVLLEYQPKIEVRQHIQYIGNSCPNPKPTSLKQLYDIEKIARTVYQDPEISAFPPMPTSNPMNMTVANWWAKCHMDQDQPLAEAILDNYLHVSIDEFKSSLKASVQAFNSEISKLPLKDQGFVIKRDAEEHKSSAWVTSIALPFFSHLPEKIVYDPQNHDFSIKPNAVNNIVILDDAAYSCSQLAETVVEIDDLLNDQNITPLNATVNVWTIVPYKKSPYCEHPAVENEPFKHISSLFSMPSIQPKHFRGLEEAKVYSIKALKHLYPGEQWSHLHDHENAQVLMHFDHKLADSWSTLFAIFDTTVVPYNSRDNQQDYKQQMKNSFCRTLHNQKSPMVKNPTPPYQEGELHYFD